MQYPNNIKKTYTKLTVSHSNRGMNLENAINQSNEYYLRNDIAVIYKKPTPITINKVDFKSRKDAVITVGRANDNIVEYIVTYNEKIDILDKSKILIENGIIKSIFNSKKFIIAQINTEERRCRAYLLALTEYVSNIRISHINWSYFNLLFNGINYDLSEIDKPLMIITILYSIIISFFLFCQYIRILQMMINTISFHINFPF